MDEACRLVERIAQGDLGAFEAVYDGYHRFVYAVAFRILSSSEQAEDVTQSVFLNLWRTPGTFRGGDFRRWLGVVSRNRALDVARARRPDLGLTEVERTLPFVEGIADAVAVQIDAELARTAMAALPSAQRESIELAFFGGLSHQEIAMRTATPLGTVKTRIRTGLRTLRATLGARVPS